MLAVTYTGTSGQRIPARALGGFSLRETSGSAPAAVNLYDGTPSGTRVASPGAVASGSTHAYLGESGIGLSSGYLYVEVVSGIFAGALWVDQ